MDVIQTKLLPLFDVAPRVPLLKSFGNHHWFVALPTLTLSYYATFFDTWNPEIYVPMGSMNFHSHSGCGDVPRFTSKLDFLIRPNSMREC